MSYNPYEKSISQIIIRRPYDARADAEHYIANLKRMEAGKVPPAIGVNITQKDPRMMLKILEARAENPSLEEELRNESARLANEIKRSLEENIMIMLTEVGVDANALKYTAELNRELQKEVEKWKDLYGRMNVENGELQTENARLRADENMKGEKQMLNEMIEKKVIVRGDRSGVFFGTLKAKEGSEVTLTACRRLWYWDGAASISQLAVDGTAKPDNCKFTVTVDEITIMDAIEIIPCTDKAIASIEGVKLWKM